MKPLWLPLRSGDFNRRLVLPATGGILFAFHVPIGIAF